MLLNIKDNIRPISDFRKSYEKHFRASYFRGVKDIEQEKTVSHNQVKQTLRQAIRRSLN